MIALTAKAACVQMPKRIICVTDMQWDAANTNNRYWDNTAVGNQLNKII